MKRIQDWQEFQNEGLKDVLLGSAIGLSSLFGSGGEAKAAPEALPKDTIFTENPKDVRLEQYKMQKELRNKSLENLKAAKKIYNDKKRNFKISMTETIPFDKRNKKAFEKEIKYQELFDSPDGPMTYRWVKDKNGKDKYEILEAFKPFYLYGFPYEKYHMDPENPNKGFCYSDIEKGQAGGEYVIGCLLPHNTKNLAKKAGVLPEKLVVIRIYPPWSYPPYKSPFINSTVIIPIYPEPTPVSYKPKPVVKDDTLSRATTPASTTSSKKLKGESVFGPTGSLIGFYHTKTNTFYPDWQNLAGRAKVNKGDSEMLNDTERLLDFLKYKGITEPTIADARDFEITRNGIIITKS